MCIDKSDKLLFKEAVDAFMPIDKDARHYSKIKKQNPFTAYSFVTEGVIGAEEVVSYIKNGVSKKMANKIKRGHIADAPNLDLHGYTLEKACQMLSNFMHKHQFENFLHIIHGKGYSSDNKMGVLKTQVVNVLRQHPQVLAFHSCPHKDGGTGAVFVLLKQGHAN